MAKKAGGFKKDKFGFPDPLHFEIGHSHKKLMELLYFLVVIGAIISILLLNVVGILSVDQKNASSMLVLMLCIVLAVMLVERSMISHKAKKKGAPPKTAGAKQKKK